MQDAIKAGAKAIVITVGASHAANGARTATATSINWSAVDAIKQGVSVPVIVKGITTPAEATAALQHNVQGIIASNFGGLLANKDAMILALPTIVDAVGGKVPVLTDGSFRRGTDILKALAFGAQGVLLGRPVMWGLAAYGEAGVQSVVEMAQTELARYMGMCGKPNLKALDRTAVKVHGPIPTKATTNSHDERAQTTQPSACCQVSVRPSVGNIERQWQQSLSRRKALAGMASLLAGSPLLHAQLDPRPFYDAQTHAWAERDAQRVRLRAGDVRERPAVGLRLHRARRRRRMEPSAQPSGVRLGRSDSRQGRRSVDGRSLVEAAGPEAEISDPHRADGDAGGAASRRRGGDVSRRVAVVEHADVPEQQLEPVGRAGGEGGAGSVVVAVLSTAGPGREPGAARARAGRRLYRDGHHGRSAGVVLRAQPARSQSRRHARGGAGRGAWTRRRGAGAARQSGAGRANDPEALGTATIGRGAAAPGPAAAAPRRRRRRVAVPPRIASAAGRLWYSWEYLDQVRKFIKAPIIIKGIVTAEDARLCVERGFDGIVVSNHGGRSMDYGPSTLEALPEIVAAVNGKIPVMIDSGFRRGSDVLKALALGADAVWLGRAARWALGAFGPVGVQRLLTDIIFKELVDAAAATGKTTLASIDSSIVKQNWP